MANIPGMLHTIPWCDPPIAYIFGDEDNKLLTTDWGGNFCVIGDCKMVAWHVLKYAVRISEGGYIGKCSGTSFSRFEFSFRDGIAVKARNDNENDPEVLNLIEEMQKLIKLKAFF